MFNALTTILALLQDAPSAENSSAPAETTPPPADKATDPVADITTAISKYVGETIANTTWTGWIILFSGILGGLIAGLIVSRVFRKVGEKLVSRGWTARGSIFKYLAGPANLAVFSFFLGLGFSGVAMDTALAEFVARFIGLLYVVAVAWFLYNLIDLIELGIRRITTDSTIIQLIRKALRIFLLIMFALFVAENFFGADITAWIAGLGLAGLAVSLAAQGPIKNLFGSVTVVLDRPFGLGDRIKFADKVGVVEVMGFRSTKLRTMEGHLVTIPNSKLIEDVVENISARPHIRRAMDVTITYDTPPEKVELAIRIIKDLLAEPFMAETFNMTDFPPRVAFNTFNADSLNISVSYWYQLNVEGRDWWTFNAQAEQFNLKLLRAYNEAGISFAFPSQTVYLAGDSDRQLAIRLLSNGDPALDGDRHARLS